MSLGSSSWSTVLGAPGRLSTCKYLRPITPISGLRAWTQTLTHIQLHTLLTGHAAQTEQVHLNQLHTLPPEHAQELSKCT